MNRTISIIGGGRVGRTLGKRLYRAGWRIGAVVSRSNAHAAAAVRWIGAGTPRGHLSANDFVSRVILLATPDAAIAAVAKALSRAGIKDLPGKIVLHTSGALDSSVLAPLARRGAATGSLHPMQTFSGREVPNLKKIIFTIEGAPAARRVAAQIARQLGGTPVALDARGKAAYHAAGTLVAGHGLALMEAAAQILLKLGFTRRRALEALLPLMRQMLDNFERLGPQAAWTGPLARKDYAIVSGHAKALRRYPREYQAAYAALAVLSGRVLAKDSPRMIAATRAAIRSVRSEGRR
ncbi:MAG TPA: Rossmann-like and DUF2520 domain-containing protein [Candidatus Acidoferrales bacterium]|nr:Rossmann-like and DUF2520 domain-containing protein [Candidatus Acidoferrales bacterium]